MRPRTQGHLVCFGLSGALTAVDLQGHTQTRVLTDLPSLANPDGSSATGPSDISFGHRAPWMTIGLGGPSTTRDLLPPEGQGMGKLYRLSAQGLAAVADFHAYEVANNAGRGVGRLGHRVQPELGGRDRQAARRR